MQILPWAAFIGLSLSAPHGVWGAALRNQCPRPAVGSVVTEPADLRSQNGVLEAELRISDVPAANGSILYCYTDAAGHQSPNLRVNPGDLVILHLKNDLTGAGLTEPGPGSAPTNRTDGH